MNSFLLQFALTHLALGCAIVALATVALRVMRKPNAATRHTIWLVVLILLTTMPIWVLAPSPSIDQPALAVGESRPTASATVTMDAIPAAINTAAPTPGSLPDERHGPAIGATLLAFWLAGLAVGALRLVRGVRRTRWHYDESHPASSEETRIAQQLAREAGIRRIVEVRRSGAIDSPMTVGILRPWIALPETWPGRSRPELLQHTLAHEIAHVARHDPLTALAGRIARGLFFYHPGVLYACHRMAEDRESACDDWAIARSGRTSSRPYAESLLAVAEAMVTRVDPLLAVGCLRSKPELTRRVTHMFDRNQDHSPKTRWTRVVPLGVAAFASLFLARSAWPDTALLGANVRTLAAATTPGGTASSHGFAEIGADEGLLHASASNDLPLARTLIENGAEVDEIHRRDGSPRTALVAAAGRGYGEMVALLLEAGADPDVVGPGDASALMAALRHDHEGIALALLDAGADPDVRLRGDGTPLIAAAAAGNAAMVTELLARGADPGAAVAGDGSPLIAAVRAASLETVTVLLSAGADPDQWVNGDEAPLYHAVTGRDHDIAAVLLEAGANPNARWRGDGTPVSIAVRHGDLAMARLLVDAGADPDGAVQGDGNALIEAVRKGDVDGVRLVLDLGADVNAGVRGDGTPLINAARMGRPDLVSVLLAAGAEVNQAQRDDDTPLINAVWSGNEAVVALLLDHGADVDQPGDRESTFGARRTPMNQATDPGIRQLLARGTER